MQVVMAGVPGAGKGTQAALLSKHLGIPHISTGEIFRSAIAAGTELGKLAASLINKGHFVPDNITLGIVAERIQAPDCANGYILDGFPRTVAQAKAMLSFTGNQVSDEGSGEENALSSGSEEKPMLSLYPDVVVLLDVSPTVAVQRIVQRLTCKQCGTVYGLADQLAGQCPKCGGVLGRRIDDTEPVALERMDVYYRLTKPAIEYLRGQNVPTIVVDGTGTVEGVFSSILDGFEKLGLTSSVHG